MLAFLAWVLALVSGLFVALGLLSAMLLGAGSRTEAEDCRCGATGPDEAAAVVVGRAAGRDGDRLLIEVERVERGEVAARQAARSYGVELSPWRRYRLFLFADGADFVLSDQVAPEPIGGLSRPAGFGALGALPDTIRHGIAAVPVLLASMVVLLVEHHASRRRRPAEAPVLSPAGEPSG